MAECMYCGEMAEYRKTFANGIIRYYCSRDNCRDIGKRNVIAYCDGSIHNDVKMMSYSCIIFKYDEVLAGYSGAVSYAHGERPTIQDIELAAVKLSLANVPNGAIITTDNDFYGAARGTVGVDGVIKECSARNILLKFKRDANFSVAPHKAAHRMCKEMRTIIAQYKYG